MPTVMMMMILGMRSRDMFLQCPCTALTSQAKGRGASGDLWWPLSKLTHGVGKHTAPADSPADLSLLLFMDLTGEKVPSTECLNSCVLDPLITVLILFKKQKQPPPFKLPPHFISAECSQQNTFVCF